jgi:type II secretion system protein J
MKTALLQSNSPAAGFTLIELVLALAIAAIVLVAINSVLFGALHLRNSTVAIAEQTLPVERAVESIKNDLVCIRPPSTNGYIGVMGTDTNAVGVSQSPILEIYTSSGRISDDLPWGDIQQVFWWLQAPTNNSTSGRDLIRGVNRNLLATAPATPEAHCILHNVSDMHLSFYDGTNWEPTWSVTLSNVPQAIKVFLTFSKPPDGTPTSPPMQFLVPIITQLSTNM